jgi:hypothetical protein
MNNITDELAKLHELTGAEFSRQVERIALRNEFYPLEGETDIYITGGETSDDFENQLNAARKAVMHGYRVFVLPNPKGIRTADFIFERKGTYKMYDLKTISGKASAKNRLLESIGQTNHVLLNMATDYNARSLAKDLLAYFTTNPNAFEVMIFKRNKVIQVKRVSVENHDFIKKFILFYHK